MRIRKNDEPIRIYSLQISFPHGTREKKILRESTKTSQVNKKLKDCIEIV